MILLRQSPQIWNLTAWVCQYFRKYFEYANISFLSILEVAKHKNAKAMADISSVLTGMSNNYSVPTWNYYINLTVFRSSIANWRPWGREKKNEKRISALISGKVILIPLIFFLKLVIPWSVSTHVEHLVCNQENASGSCSLAWNTTKLNQQNICKLWAKFEYLSQKKFSRWKTHY